MNLKSFIRNNKKGLALLLITILFVALIKFFYGRGVPYLEDNKKAEVQGDKKIELLSLNTSLSGEIDLDGLEKEKNLIPGAYAKRTVALLRHMGYADSYDENFVSSIHMNGNLLQSDNFSFVFGEDVYEIIVLDNEYNEEEFKEVELRNNFIDEGDFIKINHFYKDWNSELMEKSPLFLVDNNKYIRIPNNEKTSVFIFPLDGVNFTIENLSIVDDSNTLSTGVLFNVLDIKGNDWSGSIKPLIIKINLIKDLDLNSKHLKIKDTLIPL